jgi:transposase
MVRRYGLRDAQWETMKHVLPGREETVGVTAQDNRLFVEAVLYRDRAGRPWRALPERCGAWNHLHRRPRRGAASGVWRKVFAPLAAEADNAYAMMAATLVRAHPHAAGAKGGENHRRQRALKRRTAHHNPCDL